MRNGGSKGNRETPGLPARLLSAAAIVHAPAALSHTDDVKVRPYKPAGTQESDGSARDRDRGGRSVLLRRAGGQLQRRGRAESARRRDQARRGADGELAAVRRAPRLERRAVLRRIQLEQDRQRRSEDA